MSWDYNCPKCEAFLNPGRAVILRMSRGEVDCLVGMHPQPGKYEIHLPPGLTIEDGTVWEFACPMCGKALMTKLEPNLCELQLTVDDDHVRVFFSRVAGEHATFLCRDDQPCEEYGPDAERYAPRGRKSAAEKC